MTACLTAQAACLPASLPHPPCRSISNIQWWLNPFGPDGGNEYNLMPLPVRFLFKAKVLAATSSTPCPCRCVGSSLRQMWRLGKGKEKGSLRRQMWRLGNSGSARSFPHPGGGPAAAALGGAHRSANALKGIRSAPLVVWVAGGSQDSLALHQPILPSRPA